MTFISKAGRMAASCAIAMAIVGAGVMPGCTASPPSEDAGVAATFGEHSISEDEVTGYTQDFRERNNLEDDAMWESYLEDRSLTPQTWREETIRTMVDRILIEELAEQYGIVADEDEASMRVAAAKAGAGIADDNEQAWVDYLASRGQTPESFLDTYLFSSIEQQVFSHDIDFSGDVLEESCDEYIRNTLADQIVHRYSAIEFPLDEEAAASACADELSALTGDELIDRFEGYLQSRYGESSASVEDADVSWDFVYDEPTIDPDLVLRKSMLEPGELLGEPLRGLDCLRVVLCTERVSFSKVDYASLESESLKEIISSLAKLSGWTALGEEYLRDLETGADVRVMPMPDNLPYDVDGQDGSNGNG